MKKQYLKRKIASFTLSLAIASSASAVINSPVFATSELNNDIKDVENIDESELSLVENSGFEIQQISEYEEVESHKVSVIVTKVDQNGLPLEGAFLQIIDSKGNVIDEWLSDGLEHECLLPEGDYILHEENAPQGYIISEDKKFTVNVVINEINAGVDHDDSHDVCWHYGGVPLYYVESAGEKEEVYCVNQGWNEPDNINYDGVILTEENIKTFVPEADPNMENSELYHKILDIVYHRTKASEVFPELSDVEIRYVTEFALKNYTSAMVDNGTLFRRYKYDPTSNTGHVEDLGNGDSLGQLAKHWWYYHGRQTLPEEYALLYLYLVSEEDPHPEDMYLYVYSTKQLTLEGENYQNLLGVRLFSPYDEEHEMHLTNVNTLQSVEEFEEDEPKKEIIDEAPDTGIDYCDYKNLGLGLGFIVCGVAGLTSFKKIRRR